AAAEGTAPARSSTTHAAGCAVSSTPPPTDVTAAIAPASSVAPVLLAISSARPSRATNAPASQVSSAPARLAPGSWCGSDGFEGSDMVAPRVGNTTARRRSAPQQPYGSDSVRCVVPGSAGPEQHGRADHPEHTDQCAGVAGVAEHRPQGEQHVQPTDDGQPDQGALGTLEREDAEHQWNRAHHDHHDAGNHERGSGHPGGGAEGLGERCTS